MPSNITCHIPSSVTSNAMSHHIPSDITFHIPCSLTTPAHSHLMPIDIPCHIPGSVTSQDMPSDITTPAQSHHMLIHMICPVTSQCHHMPCHKPLLCDFKSEIEVFPPFLWVEAVKVEFVRDEAVDQSTKRHPIRPGRRKVRHFNILQGREKNEHK